ncbi:glycosyltransferase [Nosocomiicoccus sp. HMSC09A07]|uniref:glycosyltransferase n=1 Tax=Nosocomiicoccus sp. HMSC09A07 TaxID=1581145 RepID=UPI0008A61754|nr:glycosyltransferase [Nosocomiicoccus sp. HMSC09A07]OFS62738.1 hypothetical protein HMPREF3177_05360 [Nosocomiicoccus sp. HMSC09A07]
MKDLSIIIPVYNKEPALEQCLKSVVELDIDHSRIEAIVVDDKSTDKSMEIVNIFADKYDFFNVIELETNSGSPSKPRNVGIKEAQGKYIVLLDADDWLDSRGIPEILQQALENNSDFVFGHAIKHTEKIVTKLGRFTSYKKENNIIPYDINKIYRAVGPPGKLFKRSIIIDNNIEFKNLKFGEDKLFFIEAIALSETASMNPAPVYHVNRYEGNESLVGQTSIIEKSILNLAVLEEVIKLDIPSRAKYQAINRIIEVDYLARLFNRVRFLRADNKQPFYDVFYEMLRVLEKYDLAVDEFVTNKKLKNILQLILEKRHDDLHEYVHMLTRGEKARKYIKDDIVHFILPEKLTEFYPITEEMFAVYTGAREIDGEIFETITVYSKKIDKIIKVLLTEMKNEINEREIEYRIHDNVIYIKTEDLEFDSNNFNIIIIYDDYKPFIVNASYPSAVNQSRLNRQSFKAEFIDHEFDDYYYKPELTYLNYIKNFAKNVITLKEISKYKTIISDELETEKIPKGTVMKVKDFVRDRLGNARFILKNDDIIEANFKNINPLNPNLKDSYIIDVPQKVRIRQKCNLYKEITFKSRPIKTLWPGSFLEIKKIEYTSSNTPRLVTKDNYYITANKEFVKVIE